MASQESTSKTCKVCQETKPLDAFTIRSVLCRPCKRAYNMAYREAHAKELQASSQQYYQEHKDACLARMKAWVAENRPRSNAIKKTSALAHPETGKRSNRRYRLAHPDRRKATFDAWRSKNRAKMVLYQQKRTATQRNAPRNDLTPAEWEEIKAAYGHCCVYCGRQMQRLAMDHLTPLSQGGSHTKQNVVPACKSCNSKKGTGAVLRPVQPLLL